MNKSPTGRSLHEYMADRIRRDPPLGEALLRDATQALIDNELDVARSLIRDVIKGTIGYAELSRRTGTPEKSLIRMFGPKGSPTLTNACAVLAQLQQQAGIHLSVSSAPAPRRRAKSRRAA